ncbi:MAG TPA: VCBS repeat-containing protein, partial [Terriglobales bacterium]|nr:VCBS repeat-containing protein [Terriglobales bacterium]
MSFRTLTSFFVLFLILSLSTPVYPAIDSLLQPVLFPGWPKIFPWPYNSSPAQSVSLTSLDTGPELKIVGGLPHDSLYIWKYDGTNIVNWPVMAGIDSGVWQITPAIGDVDGDGQVEIVATKWQGGIQDEYPCELFAFRKDGSLMPGFPVGFKGLKATAPALYDLNGDGKLEIVVSGQTYYQTDTLV